MDENILGMIASAAVGVFALIFGAFQLLKHRKGAEFHAAKGKGCPNCGCLEFQFSPGQANSTVIALERICSECKRAYTVPPPWWIGLIAYMAALIVVAVMVFDMVSSPRDWPMHFTWRGRLAVLAFAGALIWMGTRVIQGKTQMRSDA
jgi:hypothetical protein